jgi:oxaloacetate decarboxylase alpha subunit
MGVSALQCASGAAADGISNPPIQRIVTNLRELKHRVDVDDEALAKVANYFTALAAAEGLDVGRPQGFDAAYLKHQLPGGTVGTMRRHLAESRIAHLEGAVLEELDRVRQELGWPIVMTPFAQMVITQAVMNVTGGRYETIPDEVIRYALGRFGKPNVPIDATVMDRIESLPRTRELRAEVPMDLDELRRRLGPGLGDEEFLLRATMPAGLVDAMRAAGPAPRRYDPAAKPVLELLARLLARRDLEEINLEKPGFRLALRRDTARVTP